MKYLIMEFLYRFFLKPILFKQDPEKIHDRFLHLGRHLGKHKLCRSLTKWLFSFEDESLAQNILNIKFKNPVGLSAGFDKDANLLNILENVGFGFMQVGTTTFKPYEGNPKPRLYRLIKSKGLVVNYGLKNKGIDYVIKQMEKSKSSFIKSVSIGKTNCQETASEEAGIKDYVEGTKKIIQSGVGHFYTLNISCPNTFGGEPFTTSLSLEKLLKEIYALKPQKPIFLKLPINLEWKKFKNLLNVAVKYKVDGVIIGNLNKDRENKDIKDKIPLHIRGNIGGRPNKKLSNKLISQTYKEYGDKLVIIGVGGVFSAKDAYEKIQLGASLVQLITGMIYEGPQLIGGINKELVQLLKKDGYKNIKEAIGSGYVQDVRTALASKEC